jgi:hypothetical protein
MTGSESTSRRSYDQNDYNSVAAKLSAKSQIQRKVKVFPVADLVKIQAVIRRKHIRIDNETFE